jgi:maltose phosphorylase
MKDDDIGAIRYSIKSLNFSGVIELSPYIDGDVKNRDANYDEVFWTIEEKSANRNQVQLLSKTLKSNFSVCMSMQVEVEKE